MYPLYDADDENSCANTAIFPETTADANSSHMQYTHNTTTGDAKPSAISTTTLTDTTVDDNLFPVICTHHTTTHDVK